ncbi:MAG: protoheme IX farnesyltransferase [Oligoflexia bacterium]|nr:protoheme IX farnesyltransferase [Oligoflexia bacterium]
MKNYALLTRPGIIFGNLLATLAGYFLGAKGKIELTALLGSVFGLSLIIACATVFNNIFDRDIDCIMKRTKNRSIPKGLIAIRAAFIFASILGTIGLIVLYFSTNLLTLGLSCVGLFIYLLVYTFWLKRNSIHATFIGGFSGAIPPLVGYAAATNSLDLKALLLFLSLCFWQMPHAFAIAIFHEKDFQKTKLPLLPLLKSPIKTKMTMLIYSILFLAVVMLFPLLNFKDTNYSFVAGIAASLWVLINLLGLCFKDYLRWAKYVFVSSIVVIIVFNFAIIML